MIFKLLIKEFRIDGNSGKCKKLWNVYRIKIVEILYYGTYMRLILEGNQNFLYTSVAELKVFDISEPAFIVSNVVAIGVVLLCIALLVAPFYYFYKHLNGYDSDERYYYEEAYTDQKNTRYARLYTPMLLFRRTFLVVIIILCKPVGRNFQFGAFLILQLAYTTQYVIIRPFEKKLQFVIELINEILFIFLIVVFYILSTEDDWTKSRTSAVINVFLGNTVIVVILIMCKFVLF
jgi:hypothetical protein